MLAAARALSRDRIARKFPTAIESPSAARLATPTIRTAVCDSAPPATPATTANVVMMPTAPCGSTWVDSRATDPFRLPGLERFDEGDDVVDPDLHAGVGGIQSAKDGAPHGHVTRPVCRELGGKTGHE